MSVMDSGEVHFRRVSDGIFGADCMNFLRSVSGLSFVLSGISEKTAASYASHLDVKSSIGALFSCWKSVLSPQGGVMLIS